MVEIRELDPETLSQIELTLLTNADSDDLLVFAEDPASKGNFWFRWLEFIPTVEVSDGLENSKELIVTLDRDVEGYERLLSGQEADTLLCAYHLTREKILSTGASYALGKARYTGSRIGFDDYIHHIGAKFINTRIDNNLGLPIQRDLSHLSNEMPELFYRLHKDIKDVRDFLSANGYSPNTIDDDIITIFRLGEVLKLAPELQEIFEPEYHTRIFTTDPLDAGQKPREARYSVNAAIVPFMGKESYSLTITDYRPYDEPKIRKTWKIGSADSEQGKNQFQRDFFNLSS